MNTSVFKDSQKRLYFICFLLSGFCGLLYQIIWLRLAYAAFGVVTPVLSVVVSVFMAGLSLGSVLAGNAVIPLCKKYNVSAVKIYALTELLIGAGAIAVPWLFQFSENLLLNAGSTDSSAYLIQSAVAIAVTLLPCCILMGTTYPLVLAHIKQTDQSQDSSFGFLYWANVCGAASAVVLTAFVLIELLGLRGCLLFGCLLNTVVSLIALKLIKSPAKSEIAEACLVIEEKQRTRERLGSTYLMLFFTGLISMGFEIAWTRSFMPVLGTVIYSFALLLFVYLISTALGSQRYVNDKRRGRVFRLDHLVVAAALTSLLPTLMNGFRTEAIYLTTDFAAEAGWRALLALFSIAPFSFVLGYLTPLLIDKCSNGLPAIAGRAYAVNSVGCILGPLMASYLLLPAFGARYTNLLLAAPLVVMAMLCLLKGNIRPVARISAAGALTAGLAAAAFFTGSYEEPRIVGAKVYRDYTATTFVWGEGENAELLVNGRRMTLIRPWVKMESHIPVVMHNGPVKSALVICLGMGTSFRSLLSWKTDVTVAELVPGVKKGLPYFYADVEPHMDKIVVDDGRRYLKRCNRRFDVITIDAPPPVEAAGSSLLYSKEFCAMLRARLNEGGILQLWFPSDERAVLAAVTSAVQDNFPYVRVFQSAEGWGYHVMASDRPLVVPSTAQVRNMITPEVMQDLKEGSVGDDAKDPMRLFQRVFNAEIPVQEVLAAKQTDILDDRPMNEYCLLRRMTTGKPEEWHTVKVRH